MSSYTEEFVKEVTRRKLDLKLAHPAEPSAEYATFVKLARLDRGLSREGLAKLMAVSPVFIALLENQWLTPGELTPEYVLLIDVFLGISYEAFIKHYGQRITGYLADKKQLDEDLSALMRGDE